MAHCRCLGHALGNGAPPMQRFHPLQFEEPVDPEEKGMASTGGILLVLTP